MSETGIQTNEVSKLYLTKNAREVLKKRYLKRDNDGNPIEPPEDMFQRVADNIAFAEMNYKGATKERVNEVKEKFYNLMTSLRFLPNSPTLMNAGRELQQLSACFVLPVGDSMPEIFEAIKQTALIHQSGGGTGFSFSKLRPKNDLVSRTKGQASGPISFMKVFDAATETVKQGGTRRGANMGMLRVDHPDILEFISCKAEEGILSNFNLSVAITDKFMDALKKDEKYALVNPNGRAVVGELSAKEVFDKIVEMAWNNGEPGIIFIDRMNASNPTPIAGDIEATNPCGEQPLLPYESCNLGSINLSRMVDNDKVNWDLLRETTWASVHFLDNVIDVNKYPLPEIDRVTKLNRKIGLGVMGWADMLLKLQIPYSSDAAVELAGEIMEFIREEAYLASEDLAKERGTFPNWKGSIHNGNGPNTRRLRNASVTTIAPTGSLSIIAGCSSGIEPVFNWQQTSTQAGVELVWEHPLWTEFKNDEYLPEYFLKSDQISTNWHIKMQAAFQRFIDSAVSKTVNLANSATQEDVADVYLKAYEYGCKGVTVYRDGSRNEQVFNSKGSKKIKNGSLPEILDEKRVVVKTNEGKYYIHISHENGEPRELFVNVPAIGKSRAWVECIARLISKAMRNGVAIEKLVDQLYESHLQYGDVTNPLIHINKGIMKILDELDKKINVALQCPDCGGDYVMEEGCLKCYICGSSKCA